MAGVSAASTTLSGHWLENVFHTLPAGLLNEAEAMREWHKIKINQALPQVTRDRMPQWGQSKVAKSLWVGAARPLVSRSVATDQGGEKERGGGKEKGSNSEDRLEGGGTAAGREMFVFIEIKMSQ